MTLPLISILALIVITSVLQPFLKAEPLSIEEATKLYTKLQASQFNEPAEGCFALGDQYFEVIIDKDHPLKVESISKEEMLKKPSHDRPACNKKEKNTYLREAEIADKNNLVICNSHTDFAFTLRRNHSDSKFILEGRIKGEAEPKFIKEISGNSAYLANSFGYSAFENFFAFYVSDEDYGFEYGQGQTLIVLDIKTGQIRQAAIALSREADPFLAESGDIIYVGTDGHLYEYNYSTATSSRVWNNVDQAEIVQIIMPQHSNELEICVLKLRKNGRNYCTFFQENFLCEISTEFDIVDVKFLNLSASSERFDSYGRRIEAGTVALIQKRVESDSKPFKQYLRRWHKPQTALFEETSVNRDLEGFLMSPELKNIGLKLAKDSNTYEEIAQAIYTNIGNIICSSLKKKQVLETEILLKDYGSDLTYTGFNKPFSVVVKNSLDGALIPVNIWAPHNAAAVQGAIIALHGGPNVHCDTDFNSSGLVNQYYASQGFWVFAPETRGATGYGAAHEKALKNEWNGIHLQDVIAVLEYAKSTCALDEKSIFLLGHSFGGYATLAIATHPQYADKFAGYVPIALVSNVGKQFYEGSLMAEESESDAITEEGSYAEIWKTRIGFDPMTNWASNAQNHAVSPYYHLENIKKPVLQIHGTNDTTTFPSQTTDVHTQAYRFGIPLKTIMLEGIDHYFEGEFGFRSLVELPLAFFKSVLEQNLDTSTTEDPYYITNSHEFHKIQY